jgi:putative ABC transport system permease protein
MAWRECRRSRKRLLFFSSGIVVGIAALVALATLRHNMQRTIEDQSKGLLGADVALTAREPFSPEIRSWLKTVSVQREAEEIVFSSMVYFPKSGGTRLIQVRGLQGDFPFYGALRPNLPMRWKPLGAGKVL